jgi:hypothetical protein
MTTTAICFHNPGTIDHRAFTMLGLSAKEGDKSKKIGFFGTGFKYALAVLLREAQYVQIVSAGDVYTFSIGEEDFRGKKHSFISCHLEREGETTKTFELPYTTHLGHNWSLWQAYRELYTNALDESGGVMYVDDFTTHAYEMQAEHNVYVYVVGAEFEEVYNGRDKYFLNPSITAIVSDSVLRAVDKKKDSDNVVYYKGMYTGTKLSRESFLTYDYIATVALTEDRTIKDTWYIEHQLVELWAQHMSLDDLIKYLPKVSNDKYFEAHFSVPSHTSKQFITACEHLMTFKRPLPLWALRAYTRQKPLSEQLKKIKLLKHEAAMLHRACAILEYSGVSIDTSKITFVLELPETKLGMYDMIDEHIYISRSLFEGGMPRLVGTLYEEWLHMTKDLEDNCREMQNTLVDKVALLMERVYDTDTTG